jgi:glutamyl-tRNA synthetase
MTSSIPIVCRFAPSPTGFLHVGNARTALFNWLLVRRCGGRLVLRIEDTDQQRSTSEAIDPIFADLDWLGIDWDEGPRVGGTNGPYFQSQRLDIYDQYFQKLIESGRAYRAFDTPKELAAKREEAANAGGRYRYDNAGRYLTEAQIREFEAEGRPHVLRFRMPDRDIAVDDRILGEVRLGADGLEDFVIRKSDGWPTFHFAVVVDDALMGITHIVRGQDHLMNTPKHIALQEALGWTPPTYAHLPMIINMDGSKMSKRDKEKALKAGRTPPEIDVHDFRAAGYLPEALVNFIALLGWSPGGDREIMSGEELVELFGIERIGKANARFDREKLAAFNAEYIRNSEPDRLMKAARQYLESFSHPINAVDDRRMAEILSALQIRSKTLAEIAEKSNFLFVELIEYDPAAVKKVLKKGEAMALLAEVGKQLKDLGDWTEPALSASLESLCEQRGVKLGKIAQPIRVAVTGSTVSPPIFDTLLLLGRDESLARIGRTLNLFAG